MQRRRSRGAAEQAADADGVAAVATKDGAIQLLRVSAPAAATGARTDACRSEVLDAVMDRRRLMARVAGV